MQEKKLTLEDAMKAFPDNPKATQLAVGMVLMQGCSEQAYHISNSMIERNEKRIEELEKQLDFWKPLGKKWLSLKNLLADNNYESME
jgi:hypothetical protein